MKGSTFLLPAILKTVVFPPVITYFLLAYSPIKPGWLLSVTLYLAVWPALYVLRSHISLLRSARAAGNVGARPVPRVRGRWPLNLDVMADWSRSGSEEEVGRMMVLLSRRYGDIYNTRVLGEDQIITSDPRVVKHVLVDDFDNFPKGAKFRERAKDFLGDGIFNADGDRWKFHRQLTRPFFHPSHTNPALFTPHIQSFLSSLPFSSVTGASSEPFDVQDRIGRLALDIALDWLCGETPSSAHSRGPAWDQAKGRIGDAMREAQKVVGKRVKIGTPWPLFELGHDPLKEPMRIIRAFFGPLVQEAVQRSRAVQEGEGKVRLIDRLVEATSGDERLVMDQLVNILLAAKDTSASLLTFCVYVLALHPDVQDKVYAECMAESGSGPVTKEHVGRCTYTRHFINETLRLFPPVPLNIRRSLRSSLLPTSSTATHDASPLYMPGNTSIIINTVQMQRDSRVWGEDALEFRPERWEGRGGSEGFAAWNLGPRMVCLPLISGFFATNPGIGSGLEGIAHPQCLGQPFALAATHTFIILLMRHLAGTDRSDGSGKRAKIILEPSANAVASQMPTAWASDKGDGRARDGRDKVRVVADVVLAIKGGLWVAVEG